MRDNGSIAALFFTNAERFASNDFLHSPASVATLYQLSRSDYTYAEAQDEVVKLVDVYEELGCGIGVRIGFALENRPEFFLHLIALNSLGASVVPLNVGMQDDELEYLISHSECALIVAHASVIEQFTRVSAVTNQQPRVIAPEHLNQVEMLNGKVPGKIDAKTEAAIIYTSGTTGTPKGCVLANEYFRYVGKFYSEIGGLCSFKEGSDRLVTPLPVTHMNALATSFMGVLQTGNCLIQLDRFHPRSWWQTLRESRATVMHYLGVMPAMLLNSPVQENEDMGDQIRFAFGAGCDPRHHANFEKRFGVVLTEAWAMSETGAGAWITASHEPRHVGTRCFGRLPDGLEYRLIDEEGREVEQGEPGELLVRRTGDNPREYFFSGYLKDEEATNEAWEGGWFHTGDEVRVDENGFFYFVDRRKNIIRRSGENIASIEVESIILRHPQVINCVVAPVPDDIRGEEVAALVIAEQGVDPEALANGIFEMCMDNLAYYKTPGYIAFVLSIPLTSSEKVQRGEVKKIAADIVKNQACLDVNPRKKRSKT